MDDCELVPRWLEPEVFPVCWPMPGTRCRGGRSRRASRCAGQCQAHNASAAGAGGLPGVLAYARHTMPRLVPRACASNGSEPEGLPVSWPQPGTRCAGLCPAGLHPGSTSRRVFRCAGQCQAHSSLGDDLRLGPRRWPQDRPSTLKSEGCSAGSGRVGVGTLAGVSGSDVLRFALDGA